MRWLWILIREFITGMAFDLLWRLLVAIALVLFVILVLKIPVHFSR